MNIKEILLLLLLLLPAQFLAQPLRELTAQSMYTKSSICKGIFLFYFCFFLNRNEPFRKRCWCAFLFCMMFIRSTLWAILTVPIFSEMDFFYFLHCHTGYWFWKFSLIYFQVSQHFTCLFSIPFSHHEH